MIKKFEVVITARPSWSRVKSIVLNFIEQHGVDSIELSLLGPALSNRYGNIERQMPSGVKTKKFQTIREDSQFVSIAHSSLDGGISLSNSWANSRPDAILVIADRVETLGVSVAAASMQIPIIHLQGGEISGSIDDKIRDTNSKLADLHLTTNTDSKNNLISIGENEKIIKIIGCPSIDILKTQLEKDQKLLDSSAEYGGVGADFSMREPFGLILFHPDTLNFSHNISWLQCIYDATRKSNLNWFWFWPNTDFGSDSMSKTLREFRENSRSSNIRFIKNLTPETFMDLTIKSNLLVGNSSYGIREASFLGLPVLNLGFRQYRRQSGNNVMHIQNPMDFHKELKFQSSTKYSSSTLYGDGSAGKKAVRILTDWDPALKLRF
jgi:UDP-hydrolysing UDP-N-acetyl-D-glucosamine 2-epimerase